MTSPRSRVWRMAPLTSPSSSMPMVRGWLARASDAPRPDTTLVTSILRLLAAQPVQLSQQLRLFPKHTRVAAVRLSDDVRLVLVDARADARALQGLEHLAHADGLVAADRGVRAGHSSRRAGGATRVTSPLPLSTGCAASTTGSGTSTRNSTTSPSCGSRSSSPSRRAMASSSRTCHKRSAPIRKRSRTCLRVTGCRNVSGRHSSMTSPSPAPRAAARSTMMSPSCTATTWPSTTVVSALAVVGHVAPPKTSAPNKSARHPCDRSGCCDRG